MYKHLNEMGKIIKGDINGSSSGEREEREKKRSWFGRPGRQEEERLSLSNGQLVDSNTFHHPYLLNLTLLSAL